MENQTNLTGQNQVKCPRCGSTSIHVDKKGFKMTSKTSK